MANWENYIVEVNLQSVLLSIESLEVTASILVCD
jgi:hypothetical protein